jgi:hypothetical protein
MPNGPSGPHNGGSREFWGGTSISPARKGATHIAPISADNTRVSMKGKSGATPADNDNAMSESVDQANYAHNDASYHARHGQISEQADADKQVNKSIGDYNSAKSKSDKDSATIRKVLPGLKAK